LKKSFGSEKVCVYVENEAVLGGTVTGRAKVIFKIDSAKFSAIASIKTPTGLPDCSDEIKRDCLNR